MLTISGNLYILYVMVIKLISTIIGILLSVASLCFYYRDMFRGLTKPHVFTWLIWTVLTGIAFAGQLVGGAGIGSWVMGATGLASFGVFIFALFQGKKDIAVVDWLSFFACLVALGLWAITKRPLEAIILVTVTDMLAYIPTIRKSYFRPFEETLSSYFLAFLKFGITLFALEQYSIVTWLYPAALTLMSLILVMVIFLRRKRVEKTRRNERHFFNIICITVIF
jgi:hypothetical protein